MLNNNKLAKKNGYTVLEIVISMALFFLIIISATQIIYLLNRANNILLEKKNLLDEVRIAQYFFVEQINRAYTDDKKQIEINLDKNFSLEEINFFSYKNNELEDHKFIFDKNENVSVLFFGSRSNELTKKINDIKVNYDQAKKILEFNIISNDFDEVNFIMYLEDKKVKIN